MGGIGNVKMLIGFGYYITSFFIIYMHAIVKNKDNKRNRKHVPFTKAQF